MKTKIAAFTLVEILVVLAIIGILAAILFPVFSRVREQARSTQCQSNLKQIGLALQMYEADAGRLPVAWNGDELNVPANATTLPYGQGVGWTKRVLPYLKDARLYQCPSSARVNFTEFSAYTSYAINLYITNMSSSKVAAPDRTILCFDSYEVGPSSYDTGLQFFLASPGNGARHLERKNCLFVDGHVKSVGENATYDFSCPAPPNAPDAYAYTMCPN